MSDVNVYKVKGYYTVAEGGTWLPGVYETEASARAAATLDIDVLDEMVMVWSGEPIPLDVVLAYAVM